MIVWLKDLIIDRCGVINCNREIEIIDRCGGICKINSLIGNCYVICIDNYMIVCAGESPLATSKIIVLLTVFSAFGLIFTLALSKPPSC